MVGMDARANVGLRGLDVGAGPSSWQKEIDIKGAMKGIPASDFLPPYERLGEVISLEGVSGATPILKDMAKSGLFKIENFIREGNKEKGKVAAIGVRLTHQPGNSQALIVNEKGAWVQVGMTDGAVAIDNEMAKKYMDDELIWRKKEKEFQDDEEARQKEGAEWAKKIIPE